MEQHLQKKEVKQELELIPALRSRRLIECITGLDGGDHVSAKMALMNHVSELMPAGRPNYTSVVAFPKITEMAVQYGRGAMQKILFLLIKDFCESLNLVRNMNEDQMIECAAMLLDECGNFRLEDYAMFFSGAKRGKYGKIYDRMDLQVISEMLDVYWERRRDAGQRIQEEEVRRLESLGSTTRSLEAINHHDAKLIKKAEGIQAALGELRNKLSEFKTEE